MMSRQEIRSAWPEGAVPPAPQTLWRWLERLVKARQLNRDDEGTPKKPLGYWLPGMEERWPQNFMRRIMKEFPPSAPPSGGVADIPRRSFRTTGHVSEAGLPLRARCRSGWLTASWPKIPILNT
jgi:hypothetical protein